MPFAETVVKGPVGSLMNRWSSHRIVRECSEHRCKGFRRVSGVNPVLEGTPRRTALGAGRSARSAVRRRLGNRLDRHDAAAVAGPGGQDPVVAREMKPGRGDQSRQLPKRFAEAMAMAYHRMHGTDVRIARIFNTYGERMRQDDGRAVPNFIIQALKGRDLTVYGDGQQTRSICHYSDLIAGLYKLMLSDVTTPVNLGNPRKITMLDLAHKIIAMTESKSCIAFRELPQDDPRVRLPDIAKARSMLDWTPRVGPDEGLGRTIAWFKRELEK